jgi:nucleoside-diphosphate-sugar epimerase
VKILLTGVSSFTGFWFATALSAAGHEVVAPVTGALDGYSGIRADRLRQIDQTIEIVPAAAFGSERFLTLAADGQFDLLCHHGAHVADYRSPDFDVSGALAANTLNLPAVLRVMRERGLRGVVATGSVFEVGEGAPPQRAFSPYGLSKAFTAQTIAYWCEILDIPLGKFVIPNPFGPYEEPRFTAYLMRTWKANEVAQVKTPAYVRDNIHVDLLAGCYVRFCQSVSAQTSRFERYGPSGYVESVGSFAERCARELGSRLGLSCGLDLLRQTDFAEPLVRVNVDRAPEAELAWDEKAAWDSYAEHWKR